MAISMKSYGRFGNMLKAAADAKNLSADELAKKFDYSYEQFRKLIQGMSGPSPEILARICKFLGMDLNLAQRAVMADDMERHYGTGALSAFLNKDPRLSELEALLPVLDDNEWRMFMAQITGYVHQRAKKA